VHDEHDEIGSGHLSLVFYETAFVLLVITDILNRESIWLLSDGFRLTICRNDMTEGSL